ncbi:MAG: murein transglycosylase [Burkholderiaceae bacterium]|nr:murein transglycosylase [Burkholderiaceae bacterium]
MSISSLRAAAIAATLGIALALAGCGTVKLDTPEAKPEKPLLLKPADTLTAPSFADLPGWQDDDLRAAWPAYLASCQSLARKPDWKAPCSAARRVDPHNGDAIRRHFELYFTPRQIINPDGTDTGMATGYYEPLLNGSHKRGGRFQTPLHSPPGDLIAVDLSVSYPELKGGRPRGRRDGNRLVPYLSRAEIAQSKSMAKNVLLWVDDPVDAFFLQVQGSGRIRLADSGETVRVAYADTNGHPYRSIGRHLVERGELTLEQASAQGIKGWCALNPSRMQELLNVNPSYVFFRLERLRNPQQGPKGALGVPLTPQRSIAIDPHFVPLGAPVFLSTTQPGSGQPLNMLVLAQDTGSAIRGAVRADYFWGFGHEAGEQAGKMKQRAKMWLLMPRNSL